MKRILSIGNTFLILCSICIVFIIGCSTSKKAATVDTTEIRQLPKFDYSGKQNSGVGSSDITIALVDPVFVNKDAAYTQSPFNEMAKSMGNDFEELLTSKGFKIRGPFAGMGSMLFTDKKNSDFIFMVEIDLNIQGNSSTTPHKKTNWGSALAGVPALEYTYTYAGKGSIGGNLLLTALSPSFGEKLWKKNIALKPVPIEYAGKIQWKSANANIYDLIRNEPHIYNMIVRQLEQLYTETFDLVSRQIDVEEMKSVAVEAKKAEKKN